MTRTRLAVPALLLVLCFGLASAAAVAAELWQTLPPTPSRPKAEFEGTAPVNGVELYYAEYGSGQPVILLHGGLGNSDYWGDLIPAMALHYRVIVMDSRGHGRSTRDAQPYGYDLMARDVEHTEELAKTAPGAQLLILPGVSHFGMLQNPAEFNAAVLKFLAG